MNIKHFLTGKSVIIDSRQLVKKIILAIIIIFLMLASFQIGLYTANRSKYISASNKANVNDIYLGQVIGKYSEAKPGELSADVNFNLFWKVWDTLKEYYVDQDKINEKKMFYGAMRGLVSSVGDPYTVFMDPKIAEEFASDLAGTFEGIGAEIGIKNDTLTVIAPLPDMPADKAGIKAGDKILAINKESTANLSVDEAVNKIRGPKGTTVTLSIFRDGFEKVEDIVVTRGVIVVKSVKTETKDGMFIIKISNFNDDTQDLFNEAVQAAVKAKPRGIILDLRNNPGGYLDTAIEMASEWVEDGIIVTEKNYGNQKIEHTARGRARLKGFPTAVLVNQGSASASEIVSGAMQDYGLATIIGMKTYGKGSVQTLTDLEDGSSLKITVAKWYTPKDRSINDEGIKPDIEVDLTTADYEKNNDPQMDKAIEILNGKNTKN